MSVELASSNLYLRIEEFCNGMVLRNIASAIFIRHFKRHKFISSKDTHSNKVIQNFDLI